MSLSNKIFKNVPQSENGYRGSANLFVLSDGLKRPGNRGGWAELVRSTPPVFESKIKFLKGVPVSRDEQEDKTVYKVVINREEQARVPLAQCSAGAQRSAMDAAYRRTVIGFAAAIWTIPNLPSPFPTMATRGCFGGYLVGAVRGPFGLFRLSIPPPET